MNSLDLLSLHPGGTALTVYAARAAGLSPGDEILDIGCGTASSLRVLKEEFGIVPHGIDISADVIRHASEMLPEMDLRCGSAYDLPYPDDSFDAVLSECVLTLLEDPCAALLESLRVLKTGGILILSGLSVRSSGNSTDASLSHTGTTTILENNLICPSALCTFLAENGAELVLSEDRRHDLTDYVIESIMEYGSLEARIKSETEKTGTSVFDCDCRYDSHNITYYLQIFRKN